MFGIPVGRSGTHRCLQCAVAHRAHGLLELLSIVVQRRHDVIICLTSGLRSFGNGSLQCCDLGIDLLLELLLLAVPLSYAFVSITQKLRIFPVSKLIVPGQLLSRVDPRRLQPLVKSLFSLLPVRLLHLESLFEVRQILLDCRSFQVHLPNVARP